jgi:hypothetical protein
MCVIPCILRYNCYNFPTHAQFFTTLLPIPAYMFRPLWAIIRHLADCQPEDAHRATRTIRNRAKYAK